MAVVWIERIIVTDGEAVWSMRCQDYGRRLRIKETGAEPGPDEWFTVASVLTLDNCTIPWDTREQRLWLRRGDVVISLNIAGRGGVDVVRGILGDPPARASGYEFPLGPGGDLPGLNHAGVELHLRRDEIRVAVLWSNPGVLVHWMQEQAMTLEGWPLRLVIDLQGR